MLILLGKTRVNRVLEGSQKASKKGVFWDPHFGDMLDDLGLDLPGKTRCFLHAYAELPGFLRVLGDPGSILGSFFGSIVGPYFAICPVKRGWKCDLWKNSFYTVKHGENEHVLKTYGKNMV